MDVFKQFIFQGTAAFVVGVLVLVGMFALVGGMACEPAAAPSPLDPGGVAPTTSIPTTVAQGCPGADYPGFLGMPANIAAFTVAGIAAVAAFVIEKLLGIFK